MHTHNYNVRLMSLSDINKDLIFNEAIVRLDGFNNSSIKGFIQRAPELGQVGDKYILTNNEQKNAICYLFAKSHNWQIIQPKKGMCFFCEELNNFIIFNGSDWAFIDLTSKKNTVQQDVIEEGGVKETGIGDKFIGISGGVKLQGKAGHFCFYLDGNAGIDLSKLALNKFSIIVKQNSQKAYSLNWQGKILWANGASHQITQELNALDLIEFYRLYETNHFIAKVAGVNYKY